jgi:hypothetical protein
MYLLAHELFRASLLALAVACASMTITVSTVFHGLRDWLGSKNEWLGTLVGCPYCLSHWLSFIAVLLFHIVIVPCPIRGIGPIIEFLVSSFAMVTLNSIFARLIFWAYLPMK